MEEVKGCAWMRLERVGKKRRIGDCDVRPPVSRLQSSVDLIRQVKCRRAVADFMEQKVLQGSCIRWRKSAPERLVIEA